MFKGASEILFVGNRTILFCCLFFMGLYARTTVVSSQVGDLYFKDEIGNGVVSYDSISLATFFDSTGYYHRKFKSGKDTLYVKSGPRAILSQIIFIQDSHSDTLSLGVLYLASILDNTLKEYLHTLANTGYPFASLTPKILYDSLVISVVVDVEKGPLVTNTKIEIVSKNEIRPWLVERTLLFSEDSLYNQDAISLSEQKLRGQSYVKNATFGSPEIMGYGDSVTAVIPLYYDQRRQLYFDGAILYQSEGAYHVTGRVELTLNNMFGGGEGIGFSYRGEGYWQRASLTFKLPYVGGSPLTVGAQGKIEVHDSDGGFGELSARVGLDVLKVWQAGFGGAYHEVSQNATRSRYGGITLDLLRHHAPLENHIFDWQSLMYATSGFSGGDNHTMARADIDIHLLAHIPFGRFAYVGELRGGLMAFSDLDTLYDSEKFRLGGYQTVRGYGEELFPAIGFALNRSAFRFYLNKQGALYLFMDNAVKVQNHYAWADAYWMMGYGFGVTLPVRAVRVNLEWARHRLEDSGLGRLHFSISN